MRSVSRLDDMFPVVDLGKVPFESTNGNRLCLEAFLWDSDFFNRAVIKTNIGWRSPHDVRFG